MSFLFTVFPTSHAELDRTSAAPYFALHEPPLVWRDTLRRVRELVSISSTLNQLPLQRSGEAVTAFLSSLGGLRETRLTATLGYLVSRFPGEFVPLVAGN